MRSPAWCLAAAAACSLAILVEMPAHAGWGADLGRTVVTGLVRQYAHRLIQRSLYQTGRPQPANSYDQSGYRHANYSQPNYSQPNYGQSSAGFNEGHDQPAPSYTTHRAGTTHRPHGTVATAPGSLRYPTDQKFIPPPPPYPTVYPGGPDTSMSSLNSKASTRGSELVPPPPPAPSLWNDLQPVSQVSAKPLANQTASASASKLSAPAVEDDGDMPKAAPDLHHAHKVASHFQHHSGT